MPKAITLSTNDLIPANMSCTLVIKRCQSSVQKVETWIHKDLRPLKRDRTSAFMKSGTKSNAALLNNPSIVLKIPSTKPETVFQIPCPICNMPLTTALTPSHSAFAPDFSILQALPRMSALIADNADMSIDNGLVTKLTRPPTPLLMPSKQLRPNSLI